MSEALQIAKEHARAAQQTGHGNTEQFAMIAHVNAAIAQAEALERIAVTLERFACVIDDNAVRVLTLR